MSDQLDKRFEQAVRDARRRHGAAIQEAIAYLTAKAERGEPFYYDPAWDGLAEQQADLVMRLDPPNPPCNERLGGWLYYTRFGGWLIGGLTAMLRRVRELIERRRSAS